MKLKQNILNLLENNQGYGLIMMTMGASFSAAREWVKNGSDNLTKAAMLKAIREKFGLTDEEILEQETVEQI